MRDAQPDVDLTDGSWPAAVIEGLPVGLLELDARGRVVRANAAVERLLSPGAGELPAVAPQPRAGGDPVRVADRWPLLAEPTLAVLAGRSVDRLVTSAHRVLRVRGVPRWVGPPPYGGLIVVSETTASAGPAGAAGPAGQAGTVGQSGTVGQAGTVGSADPTPPGPAVVDLRDTGPVVDGGRAPVGVRGTRPAAAGSAFGGAAPDGPASEGARRGVAAWLRPAAAAAAAARRRPTLHRPEVHAATHDAATGLPNQVLLLQCLTDALRRCPDGRRVALLMLDVAVARPLRVLTGHHLDDGADDGAVRRAAALLVQISEPDDVVARLAGDRLVVLMRDLRPDADLEGFGALVAERLRSRVGDGVTLTGPGLVIADPAGGGDRDRNPRWVLALALEALERSREAGRPVLAPELPARAERERLEALWSYDVNDAVLDDVLQGVTQVAVTACEASAALLTFVDCDLQWVRAATGVDAGRLVDVPGPRHLALCDRTIRGRDVLVVPDTSFDPEFRSTRHVGWQLGVRFYAGTPLLTAQGRALGTLCVVDRRPRGLTERQRRSLTVLAAETVALLEAHRARG